MLHATNSNYDYYSKDKRKDSVWPESNLILKAGTVNLLCNARGFAAHVF